jgi:acylglycerol lipase
MSAAALMVMATQPNPPPVDGYVLISPAVWGRVKMNLLMRVSLWLADKTVPGLTLTGGGLVRVTASDNRAALVRLSTDPLTIHSTRVDGDCRKFWGQAGFLRSRLPREWPSS